MSVNPDDVIVITRGEKAVINIFLEKPDSFPRPVDLTDFDEFEACFLNTISGDPLVVTHVANANGSIIEKVSPDVLGQLKVTLEPTDTLLFEASDVTQDIDIQWNNSITPNKKRKRLYKVIMIDDYCA